MNRNIELMQRELDKIPFRINFIKTLLDDKDLNSLVDFDKYDTVSFIGSINENDIRERIEKQLLEFHEVFNKLNSRIIYIKSGTTGHTFKGKKNNSDISFAVKVVAYPKSDKYGDIYDIKRPENAELLMLKVLSYFVINKQTPHIILPIGTFNTKIDPFINIHKGNRKKVIKSKKYDEFIKNYHKGYFHNTVSILLSEWANNGDLSDYIKANKKQMSLITWKVIFFQIISTLAVIHKKYPNFRHNDLKANNILVHKIEADNTYFKYSINGQIYEIPNTGIIIKLWDFDFACIPGKVDNNKVNAKWSDAINIKPIANKYYDVYYFFNTLTKKGFFPELFIADYVHNDIKEFIRRIVPEEFTKGEFVNIRKKEKGEYKIVTGDRILTNEEYTTPDQILKNDKFFAEFRI